MKFVTKVINIFSGCLQLAIPPALYAQVAQLQQAVNSGKELEVEITIKRKRRSLNANAYLWQLLGQMAAVLQHGQIRMKFICPCWSAMVYTPMYALNLPPWKE